MWSIAQERHFALLVRKGLTKKCIVATEVDSHLELWNKEFGPYEPKRIEYPFFFTNIPGTKPDVMILNMEKK